MFKDLFKRTIDAAEPVVQSVSRTFRSDADIVAEIHDTFYTEVDRIIEDVNNLESLKSVNHELLARQQRLERVGFTSTDVSKAAQAEREKRDEIQRSNELRVSNAEAAQYFSQKYPQYKFITDKAVDRICKKYGLIIGPSDAYVGNVPLKNLEQIEKFRIKEEDECWQQNTYMGIRYMDLAGEQRANQQYRLMREHFMSSDGPATACPYYIVAPSKDFNKERMALKGNMLVQSAPDPIVLKKVMYKGVPYNLIVTAWGPEASDEDVVNQKMN